MHVQNKRSTAWPTLVETAVQVREGRYAYKYRPNMDCQWLITAPTEKDKVEQAWDRSINSPTFLTRPGWDQVPVLRSAPSVWPPWGEGRGDCWGCKVFQYESWIVSIKVGKYITCHPPSLLTTGPGSTETPQSAQSSPALITWGWHSTRITAARREGSDSLFNLFVSLRFVHLVYPVSIPVALFSGN